MIIFQYHMLSDGNIKISKAEYKESKDRKGELCYRKVKVLEKGIRCPKFPTKFYWYHLGMYDYNKFYALSIAELKYFASLRINEFKNKIKINEIQNKTYKEMIENLENSIKEVN